MKEREIEIGRNHNESHPRFFFFLGAVRGAVVLKSGSDQQQGSACGSPRLLLYFTAFCLLHTTFLPSSVQSCCSFQRIRRNTNTHGSVRVPGRSFLLLLLFLLLPFKRVSRKPVLHQWKDGKFYHMINGGLKKKKKIPACTATFRQTRAASRGAWR